jgi:hypothetical protein
MTQLSANFQYGLNAAVGTAAQTKSFAYDEAQYVYSNSTIISIGPFAGTMGTSTIGNGGEGIAYITSYTNKQLRSITAAKWGTGSGADSISVYLASAFAQAFGTATGVSQLQAGVGTGTFYNTSTLQGTGVNVVTILNGSASGIMWWGTGQAGLSGTGSWNGGTAAPTAQVVQFPNGTFTVVVSNNQGTNSQTGYVFPTGPNGGLTVNPGDILVICKSATDTQNAYSVELEWTYTPGAYVSR